MNRSAALATLLVVACGRLRDLSSEPSRFARTERRTWSREGWEGLRWGMGPGDVEVHLATAMKLGGVFAPKASRDPGVPRLTEYELTGSGRAVAGEPTQLAFRFVDGKLFLVSEAPAFTASRERDRPEPRRVARWVFAAARAEFEGERGAPTDAEGQALLAAAERPRPESPYAAGWERASEETRIGVYLLATGVGQIVFVHRELDDLARRLEWAATQARERQWQAEQMATYAAAYGAFLDSARGQRRPVASPDGAAARAGEALRESVVRTCAAAHAPGACEAWVRRIEAEPAPYRGWTGPTAAAPGP